MFGLAAWFLARTRRFLRTAASATGVVVGLEGGPSGGTDPSGYHVVVELRTEDGRTIRWTDSMAAIPPIARRGESLPVVYDPARPERARIAKPSRLYFVPRLMGLLGGVFLLVDVVLVAIRLAI